MFALFGYASATLSRPALPLVEKHEVPFLAPFTGADPMRVFNKHVYNMRASYADELEKIVDHFAPLGVKRFVDRVLRRRRRQGEPRRRSSARSRSATSRPCRSPRSRTRAKPDIAGRREGGRPRASPTS